MNFPRMMERIIAYMLLAAMLMLAPSIGFAQEGESAMRCPAPSPTTKQDFRDRSTPQLIWSIEDNRLNHLEAARRLLEANTYSQRVMGELHWTLERYPNHHVALEMLIRYALGNGKIYNFQPPECYFQWAKQFAPNDQKVLLAEGFFFWKKNDRISAVKSYQAALEVDPNSVSAHYNLGLLYFDLKQFDDSARHAAIAYQYGYPLPGLRDKLAKAGIKMPVISENEDSESGTRNP